MNWGEGREHWGGDSCLEEGMGRLEGAPGRKLWAVGRRARCGREGRGHRGGGGEAVRGRAHFFYTDENKYVQMFY
mgnify:CR=1 FL=1